MSVKSMVLLVIGLAFLAAAAAASWRTFRFIDNSVVVDGRVSTLNAGGSHPQIDFVTEAGERISFPQGGLTFGNKAGDNVKVRYDPTDARVTASLDRFGALWAVPLALLFFSGCFLLGAAQARSTNTISSGRYG